MIYLVGTLVEAEAYAKANKLKLSLDRPAGVRWVFHRKHLGTAPDATGSRIVVLESALEWGARLTAIERLFEYRGGTDVTYVTKKPLESG